MSVFLLVRLIGLTAGLLMFGMLQQGRAQTAATATMAISAYVPAHTGDIHPKVTYGNADGTRVIARSGANLVTITY